MESRILAVDYGAKRVGIAITDPLRMFAYPLITINNDQKFWKTFLGLFKDYEVEKIVLGNPLKESGEDSATSKLVVEFKTKLENKLNIPIILFDERYSSSVAKDRILQSVNSKKKRRDKSLVDKNAAAVILEDYLAQNP